MILKGNPGMKLYFFYLRVKKHKTESIKIYRWSLIKENKNKAAFLFLFLYVHICCFFFIFLIMSKIKWQEKHLNIKNTELYFLFFFFFIIYFGQVCQILFSLFPKKSKNIPKKSPAKKMLNNLLSCRPN